MKETIVLCIFALHLSIFSSEPSSVLYSDDNDKFVAYLLDDTIRKPLDPEYLKRYCKKRIEKAEKFLKGELSKKDQESECFWLDPNSLGKDEARGGAFCQGFCRLHADFPKKLYKRFDARMQAMLAERNIDSTTQTCRQKAEEQFGDDCLQKEFAQETKKLAQEILLKVGTRAAL